MAADLSKMSCGGFSLMGGSDEGDCGGGPGLARVSTGSGVDGGSDDTAGSPMATDRRVSATSVCSPQVCCG